MGWDTKPATLRYLSQHWARPWLSVNTHRVCVKWRSYCKVGPAQEVCRVWLHPCHWLEKKFWVSKSLALLVPAAVLVAEDLTVLLSRLWMEALKAGINSGTRLAWGRAWTVNASGLQALYRTNSFIREGIYQTYYEVFMSLISILSVRTQRLRPI